MKLNYLYISMSNKQITGLSTFGYKNKSTIKHPVLSVFVAFALIFTVISASADQLWNNGDTDGSTLGWGQYSSTLDDFYVPGGGWFINRVETNGIFINPDTVSDVEIAIWPHDNNTSEPNSDDVVTLNVTDFQATSTGRTFLEREEVKITVDFDKTYLKGQRYYWIEMTVLDQHGHENFRFLARSGVSLEPAWTHFGQGSISPSIDTYGAEFDLSYVLYGNPVEVTPGIAGSSDFTFGSNDRSGVVSGIKQLTSRIPEGAARFKQPQSKVSQGIDTLDLVAPCPSGTFISPFEMPIYDENGLFVIDYKTVWFCIPNDLEPEG